MLVKEAKFYSSFPETFHGKISIKVRRINQLIRVFAKYLILLSKGKIKNAKNTVVPNTLLYLFSPIAFAIFSILTAFILVMYPFLLVLTLILFVPRIRLYFYLILENNLLLFISTIAVLLGEKFSVWVQPEDRGWLTEKNLASYNLI
jgi:hypothetical protein